MATSFEPMVFGNARKPDWIAALSDDGSFAADPRFQSRFGYGNETETSPASDLQTEAYTKGFADGESAALSRQVEEKQQTQKLKLALTKVDSAMREALEKRVQHIVASLCEATVASHFIDIVHLQERCHKAVAMLGAVQDDCTLTLHPDDIAKLDPEFSADWAIIADATLERGTVRLSHGESELVDGLKQWREALGEAIGL